MVVRRSGPLVPAVLLLGGALAHAGDAPRAQPTPAAPPPATTPAPTTPAPPTTPPPATPPPTTATASAPAAYEPPDFMTTPPALPEAADVAATWRLDLAEALRLALANNLGVAIERTSVDIAARGVDVAGGAFEPVVTARVAHGSAQSPPDTSQAGAAGDLLTTRTDDWQLGVGELLPTGTRLGVDFTNGRTRSTAGTAVAPLTYRSSVSLSVTQPLLRGFSLDLAVPRVDVLRAELTSERARHQLAITAVDVLERAEAAYWDLERALYRYALDLRSRQRADDQLALTQRQIAAGLMPPSDLLSAETTLAQRRLQLVRAAQDIDAATDRLRAVLHLPRAEWARPLLPTALPRFAPEAVTAEDALAQALAHRPELAQLALDLADRGLAVRKAENAERPQLDLGLALSLIGQDASYTNTLEQLGRADAPGYAVSVNLSWTPLGRAATATTAIERGRERLAALARDQAVQDVWLAVRDAVRALGGAAQQVEAAARFRALSTQALEVEQRRFLSGSSSNFLIAQRQEELASAQLAELSAVLDHKKAAAALLRATGRLLDARHVELAVKPTR